MSFRASRCCYAHYKCGRQTAGKGGEMHWRKEKSIRGRQNKGVGDKRGEGSWNEQALKSNEQSCLLLRMKGHSRGIRLLKCVCKVRQGDRKTNKIVRQLRAVCLPLKARCIWTRVGDRETEGGKETEVLTETNGGRKSLFFLWRLWIIWFAHFASNALLCFVC